MTEDVDTKEKSAHPSYKDMEQLNLQILLTENYYVNPNGIHICFPIKIKRKTNNALDIDADLITVNNFFAHWVKEISITRYGSVAIKNSPRYFLLGKYTNTQTVC